MLYTLLTTLPPVVHMTSTELEIPLTAVTVQSSVNGLPIVTFLSVPFPNVSLLNTVICTRGIGTIKIYIQKLLVHAYEYIILVLHFRYIYRTSYL